MASEPTTQDVTRLLQEAGVVKAQEILARARGGEEADLWAWARAGGDPDQVPAFVRRR